MMKKKGYAKGGGMMKKKGYAKGGMQKVITAKAGRTIGKTADARRTNPSEGARDLRLEPERPAQ